MGAALQRAARLALVLLVAACTGGDQPRRHVDAGPAPGRKVKPPPDPDAVRTYWPYAIRADGVGLYLLDAPLADVLHLLPEGPRVELLEIGELMSWRMVRADEGRVVIGADERSKVAFIAVLSAEVARTDAGLMVGSTGAQLGESLGDERDPGEIVRMRRVYEFEKLPGVTFITDGAPGEPAERAHVVAVLLARPQRPPVPPAPPASATPDAGVGTASPPASRAACRTGGALAEVPPAELWTLARAGRTRPRGASPRQVLRWGCVSGGEPEAILLSGDELALVGGAPGKLRRLAVVQLADAELFQPIDVNGDGRDELLSLAQVRDDQSVAVQLRAWGWSGGKLAALAPPRQVLVITREQAAAAGTTPGGIELWAEAWPAGGALQVGGVYWSRTLAGARVIAPIVPVRVRLEPGRGPELIPPGAAATHDAGAAPTVPTDGGPPPDAKGKQP